MSAQPPIQYSAQSWAMSAYFAARRDGKSEYEALQTYHDTHTKRVFDLALEHGRMTNKWPETRGSE